MARRDREPPVPEAVDLEPIEIEAIDLVDADERDRPGERSRAGHPRLRGRRTGVGLGAVAAVLVAAVAFAVVGHRNDHAPADRATPGPTTGALPGEPTSDPVIALAQRLEPIWPDGEAMVMHGRLYVARPDQPSASLVVPELPAVIEDQSGSSLLVSTFPELLVSTQPRIATRVLSPRSVAIRAAEPDEWWILSDGGTLRDDVNGTVLQPPDGLRVAAAVPHGFVALDTSHARWVLWTGEPSTTNLIGSSAQLVAVRGSTAVFRSGCSLNGCALEIYDLVRHSAIDAYVPGVPDFAAFSPTGSRLALASTLGDVFLIDPANGATIARTRSRVSPSLSSPIAWSADGEHLVVVQQDSIQVRNATDGALTDDITGTAGLEQIAGLP